MLKRILQNRIIAILRNVPLPRIADTAAALYEGGIRLAEVTFNQTGDSAETAEAIRILNREFKGRLCVGAGTVLTLEQLVKAADAGAGYIISPNADAKIIAETKRLGLISIPGVLTPSEAVSAFEAGADIIKLFPVGNLGSSYVKNIKAPLSHIKFMAVGGINDQNMLEYLNAGACAVGIGGNLVSIEAVNSGNYNQITENSMAYTKQLS